MDLNLKDIQRVIAPESPVPDMVPSGISIDTRKLVNGNIFFALKGQVDGHRYTGEAFRKGACAAVVNRSFAIRDDAVYLVVEDTLKSLQYLAAWYRKQFKTPVIAVTGTNGKTSTKEMLYQIVSMQYLTEKTPGNFNNHIGLPLSLLRWTKHLEVGILEMGTNHFGDIDMLCKIAHPTHGVITNIGEGHLEFLKDKAGVARAKGELLDHLTENGTAFLNGDDPYLLSMQKKVKETILFGFSEQCHVRGIDLVSDTNSVSFSVEDQPIQLHCPGEHNAYNALAAISVAKALNVSWQNIQDGLARFQPVDQRFQQIKIKGVTFFNDAYNANPGSLESGIRTLASMKISGRKILVMGDMLELGMKSKQAHVKMGAFIAEHHIDAIFGFGPETQHTVDRAGSLHLKFAGHYDSHDVLAEALMAFIQDGDVVLVKGSRSMKMENVLQWIQQQSNHKNEG